MNRESVLIFGFAPRRYAIDLAAVSNVIFDDTGNYPWRALIRFKSDEPSLEILDEPSAKDLFIQLGGANS